MNLSFSRELTGPPRVMYEIDLSLPSIAHIGSLIPFEFSITATDGIDEMESITLEVSTNQQVWSIAGKKKSFIELKVKFIWIYYESILILL